MDLIQAKSYAIFIVKSFTLKNGLSFTNLGFESTFDFTSISKENVKHVKNYFSFCKDADEIGILA